MNHRRSPALAALDGLFLLFIIAVALMCAPVLLTVIVWLFFGMPPRS
jgi:hypothetical protein